MGQRPETDIASLRVFMATLRKKIETDTVHPKYIQTHVGVGYRMIQVSDSLCLITPLDKGGYLLMKTRPDNRSGSCLALSIRVIELCKLQEHPALPSHRGFAQDAVVGRFSLSRLCNRLQQPVLNKLLYA